MRLKVTVSLVAKWTGLDDGVFDKVMTIVSSALSKQGCHIVLDYNVSTKYSRTDQNMVGRPYALPQTMVLLVYNSSPNPLPNLSQTTHTPLFSLLKIQRAK